MGEMQRTPTQRGEALRAADFSTLAEALDYAARCETGCNFFSGRGRLESVLPYRELRDDAMVLARRLLGLGLERGARVAIVADTTPDFHRIFFACQYAGLVPAPLPASIHLGGRGAYADQLRGLLAKAGADAALAPEVFLPSLREASEGMELLFVGTPADLDAVPTWEGTLTPSQPDELAYLQYTSGSTRFPRGVMITQRAVMSNLAGIVRHGLQVREDDRAFSWLPFYHDMGLVGFVLGPVASQMTVDYLGTRDFAMRPRQWLALMSETKATISFSPPFGYELCVRRLREGEADRYDLRAWRAAGVGAETIRAAVLEEFADAMAVSGFDRRAFLACYGMAECSLAVSFSPLGRGLEVDLVDGDYLADCGEAHPVTEDSLAPVRVHGFACCGSPLPGHQMEVRGADGRVLPERRCGTIFVRGPSVMTGYFGDVEMTREVLSPSGWLNTGDIGYRIGDRIVISGREKDLIIVNGRNIWPQDLEYLAERQPGIRTGDASAFSVPGPAGEDVAVVVVQCREADPAARTGLVERLRASVREEFGVECRVDLVAPHTLPKTSSGKPSRSAARAQFLERAGETPRPPAGGDRRPAVAVCSV